MITWKMHNLIINCRLSCDSLSRNCHRPITNCTLRITYIYIPHTNVYCTMCTLCSLPYRPPIKVSPAHSHTRSRRQITKNVCLPIPRTNARCSTRNPTYIHAHAHAENPHFAVRERDGTSRPTDRATTNPTGETVGTVAASAPDCNRYTKGRVDRGRASATRKCSRAARR